MDPLRPHFLVTSQLVDGVWFNPFHGDSCISSGWFFTPLISTYIHILFLVVSLVFFSEIGYMAVANMDRSAVIYTVIAMDRSGLPGYGNIACRF